MEPLGLDFVAELVVGAVATIGCAIGGGMLALALMGHESGPAPVPGFMAVAAIAGGLIGAYGTDKLWKRFVHKSR